MSTSRLSARIHCLRYEARDVISVELRPAREGESFPPHKAGSHIDLHLGNGLVRSYSLLNPEDDPGRYVIGVLKDRQSRGGSAFVHEKLRIGEVIDISEPRNNFALDESAERSVLVAGGIGITPILSMLQRLMSLGREAELIYCARSRADAAFVATVNAWAGPSLRVCWHFDDEAGGPPDLRALLSAHGPQTHFYACGPGPMLDAFQETCQALSYDHVHIERFAAVAAPVNAVSGSFMLELRQSGREIPVSPDCSVLDAMLDAGLSPGFSCREGICGACETRVIDGDVDHRDSILTDSERAANKTMMICVSRCRSERLVLDA